MAKKQVLISGAGIAGMALASLLPADHYDVTIVERAPAIRESGYAVDFRGDALEALGQLGLLEATRALTTRMRGTTVLDASGNLVDRLPAEAFGGDLEVPKRDFSELLHRHTRDAADFWFDDTITDLRQDAAGVLVSFERAADRRFDLIFGADGVYSRVRRLTFGPHQNFVRHLGMSGVGFSTSNFLGLDHEGVLLSVPGAAIYLFSGQDTDRLTVSLSCATESADLGRQGRARQEAALQQALAGIGWEAPRLLGEMARADDFYFGSTDQVQLDRWSDGRIVLLGDAGYCAAPTSGMGTSQALLGARALCRQLFGAGGDHGVAFEAYEKELRPYVLANQATGRAAVAGFGGRDLSAGAE